MSKKTIISIITAIIGLCYLPISFYQQWLILCKIQATDLMFFLFWMTLPLAIIIHLLGEAIKAMKDDD